MKSRRFQVILATAAFVCVCVLNPVAVADEEGEKYAHPDGGDAYGPMYEAREVPSEMKANLDDDGEYVLPSFIDRTIMVDQQECWVIDQIPAAGTVLTCPQTVVVELKHTCGQGEEFWARLPIEVRDVTPPDIAAALDSNANPLRASAACCATLRQRRSCRW